MNYKPEDVERLVDVLLSFMPWLSFEEENGNWSRSNVEIWEAFAPFRNPKPEKVVPEKTMFMDDENTKDICVLWGAARKLEAKIDAIAEKVKD